MVRPSALHGKSKSGSWRGVGAIAVIALLLTLSSAAVAQKRARRDARPAVIINVHRKNALALARHLDIATGSGFAGPSGIQQTTATRQALMFLGCNAVVVGSRDPAEMRDVAAAVGGKTLNTAPSRPATAKQGDLDRRIESSSNRSSMSSL